MKVLLINLPYYRLMRLQHRYFPLGIGYLAAVARDGGHDVHIYDMEKDPHTDFFASNLLMKNRVAAFPLFSQALTNDEHRVWQELRAVIKQTSPDVVGMTMWSTVYPAALKVARIIKEFNPAIKVVAGGSHPTSSDDQVAAQPDIDVVMRQEGEVTFKELLKALQADSFGLENILGITYKAEDRTVCKNADRPLIEDIDSISPPAFDSVLYPERYRARDWGCMITSRGCAEGCMFCGSRQLWGRNVRLRDINSVFEDMRFLSAERGVTFFTFFDDTFTFHRQRSIQLCEKIRRKKLAANWFAHGRIDHIDEDYARHLRLGGCYAMQFGVESGSQAMLDAMQKRQKLDDVLRVRQIFAEQGILFWSTFLIGYPGETEQDLEQTYMFLKQLKPDLASINVFVPYPGSGMPLTNLGGWKIGWDKVSPHSYDVKCNNIPLLPWLDARRRIEAAADGFNSQTLHSWRWRYGLYQPRLRQYLRTTDRQNNE